MNSKIAAFAAVLLLALLVAPVLADVYVPPGPPSNQSEWISPTLRVFNAKTLDPIGWQYTDGPTYNVITHDLDPQVSMEDPYVPAGNALDIPWGTQVMILGFIPQVEVSVDGVPPPVELKMTWNGIPNTITLTVPPSQVIGVNYPPTMYPDINTVYQFGYPATAPSKNATYNLWVGDYTYILQHIFGVTVPPTWWETTYGKVSGEWFWYKFTPNVGDWIALDSHGQTKFPPTYDITAMFEYGTSQIWFNHICFDTTLLQVHKDVSYCLAQPIVTSDDSSSDPASTSQTINDQVTISNVGLLPATGLDFTQTFPSEYKFSIVPDYSTAMAQITNATGVVVPWQPLPNYWAVTYPNIYNFTAPFNTLQPGQNLTITMTLTIYDTGSDFHGTVVFDSMTSATQIPAWKDPIALAALYYPPTEEPTVGVETAATDPVALWTGYVLGPSTLWGEPAGHIDFNILSIFYVPTPILRTPINQPQPTMTIDPAPVPLIAGETSVTAADVALVRNAVLGLAPYDQRMDTNGNGKIDVQDLKAYETAAGN